MIASLPSDAGEFMRDMVVFLLPHQDDEFSVFFAIEESVREGANVSCLFLTDGAFGGQSTERRNIESRNVLCRLGVREADIHFVGTRDGLCDAFLHTQLDKAL